jgi:hypothetical protein
MQKNQRSIEAELLIHEELDLIQLKMGHNTFAADTAEGQGLKSTRDYALSALLRNELQGIVHSKCGTSSCSSISTRRRLARTRKASRRGPAVPAIGRVEFKEWDDEGVANP